MVQSVSWYSPCRGTVRVVVESVSLLSRGRVCRVRVCIVVKSVSW